MAADMLKVQRIEDTDHEQRRERRRYRQADRGTGPSLRWNVAHGISVSQVTNLEFRRRAAHQSRCAQLGTGRQGQTTFDTWKLP